MRAPIEIDDLGVPRSLVEDLFMRRLLIEREAPVRSIAEHLGISLPIARSLADELRDKKMLEYHGLDGRDYKCGLTELGRATANERMQQSSYASVVPVPLGG